MNDNQTGSSESAVEGAIPRRGFLKIGLAGTALAAVGGVGLALRDSALREMPAGGLKVLTRREYSILAALADTICPSTGPDVPAPGKLDVARRIDEMFSRRDAQMQKEFRTLVGMFDNALFSFLLEGRITPFTKLSPEARARSLSNWEHSGLELKRTIFIALRRLTGMIYYSFPETWKHIGYEGPPTETALAYREINRTVMAAERAARLAKKQAPETTETESRP